MNSNKRIMATLAGFVTIFLLGWLIYGMLLMDFFQANSGTSSSVMRTDSEMIWWALIVGNLLQAYFLVYIFDKWGDITSFGSGLQAGATLGLIIGFAYDLTMYGTSNIMNLTATLVDPFVTAVLMGITGGVIGYVLGRK